MSKEFVTNNNSSVFIDDMLDFASKNIKGVDGSENVVCGNELGVLFGGFVISSEEEDFPVFKTAAELNTMFNNEEITESDLDKLVYYNKFAKNQFKILNSENIPEGDDFKVGNIYNVSPAQNDNDTLKPITQRAPVWYNGYGYDQSGTPLEEDKVGPFDMYYDTKKLLWKAITDTPMVGRVVDVTKKNPYSVEFYGINSSEEQTTSKMLSKNKVRLDDVYYTEEEIGNTLPTLASGDFVNVFLDQAHNTVLCSKPNGSTVLVKNTSGEEIPKYSFVEIDDTENNTESGKIYSVIKPSIDSSNKCFINDRSAIPSNGFAILDEDYPKSVSFTGDTPSIGDNFGPKEDSFSGEKDKSGYVVSGIFDGKVSVTKAGGGSGGSEPLAYKTTAAPFGGEVTAKRVGYDGSVTGSTEETLKVFTG